MALIYHFTSGIRPSNTGPWDTGRAGVTEISQPTTRQGIFDAIVAALSGGSGAGWSESAASAGSNRIFTSTGESTNENVVLTLTQGNNTSPDARYLRFGSALKVDASGNPDGSVNWGDGIALSGNNVIDLGATDFTADMQIFATRDFVWVFISRTPGATGTTYSMFGGLLERSGYNTNVLNLSGAVTAGSNRTITTTTNPIVAGIRVSDQLMIVEEGPAESPAAETVEVIDVSATTITVRNLQSAYSSSSRIGVIPNPVVVGHWPSNATFVQNVTSTYTSSPYRSPFIFGGTGEGSELQSDVSPATATSQAGALPIMPHILGIGRTKVAGTVDQGFGVGSDLENRTNRFLCSSVRLFKSGSGGTFVGTDAGDEGKCILGLLPRFFSYPGISNFFTHDNFVRNRNVTTNEDYLPVRFGGTGVAATQHFIVGPTPGP